MKKIIFIESSDIGAFYSAEGARQIGYEPLFISDLSKVQGDTLKQLQQEQACGNLLLADTTSAEEILKALDLAQVKVSEIAGVMTFLDSRLEVALGVGNVLKIPAFLDATILSLKSKARVQEFIPEWSPVTISFESNKVPYPEIEILLKSFSKVIVKPTKMAGAIGARIFDANNFDQIGPFIADQKIPSHLDENQWICQAFIDGALMSAEGFVENATTHILGFSDRSKVGFTESKIEFPVDHRFTEIQHHHIQKAVQDLVDRSGFKQGWFHIEFMVTEQSAFIIDANMGRLGGGPLGEIIPMSFGLDIVDFYSFVILKSLSGLKNHNQSPKYEIFEKLTNLSHRESTIGICYGSPIDGYFNHFQIAIHEEFKHTLILEPKQTVVSMGANNWSWIGIVSSMKSNFHSDINSLKLTVNNQEVTPCY